MSDITIIEANTPTLLDEFIQFPMQLYKDNKNYVPPLIGDEKQLWQENKNPALKFCEAKLFLAQQSGKTLGRIALIINHNEIKDIGLHKLKFGWIDFVDDVEVSKALLNKALDYAKEKELNEIEGPMGFTNLDKAGMLTMGFDKLATMIGIYNADYYPKHLGAFGFVIGKEWVEFELQFPEVLPEKVIKFNELIKEKYGLRVLKFKNKDEIRYLVQPMFQLLNETYKTLSSYTPVTEAQIIHYGEKYFKFISKDYIVCIADKKNDLIAFAITMPSYSKALQKAKGKVLPIGWYHLMQATRKNNLANFYLIGIHPDYQKRGVTSIIFKEMQSNLQKKGVKYLETNPELVENKAVQQLWGDYNPINHKRRCTFLMKL